MSWCFPLLCDLNNYSITSDIQLIIFPAIHGALSICLRLSLYLMFETHKFIPLSQVKGFKKYVLKHFLLY